MRSKGRLQKQYTVFTNDFIPLLQELYLIHCTMAAVMRSLSHAHCAAINSSGLTEGAGVTHVPSIFSTTRRGQMEFKGVATVFVKSLSAMFKPVCFVFIHESLSICSRSSAAATARSTIRANKSGELLVPRSRETRHSVMHVSL